MNQFNDFSIQDEFLDDQFGDDVLEFPDLGEQSNIGPIDMEVDQDVQSNLSSSHYSSGSGDFAKSIADCKSIGAQIFKNMAENKSSGFFNQKYCCIKNLGDDIDFGVTELPRLSSPVKDKSDQCLNSIAKSFNLQYQNLNSQRSCMSNKGDSRDSSLVKNTSFENAWNYCPSDLPMESMDHSDTIEKQITNSETHSIASKPMTAVGNTLLKLKLKLPEPKWNFGSTTNTGTEKVNKLKNTKIAIEDDLSYTASCMKQINGGLMNQVQQAFKTNKVMIGMNTFCDREIRNDTTSTHHDDKSTDEEFMIGRLTKTERAAKVKKYLEKKRRRKWNKQVNYESRKKVADTRPRYKGRFLSSGQAVELANELEQAQKNKIEKAKVFIVEIFDRKTKKLIKKIYPTEESLQKHSTRNLI